jgi:hypothetical protein
MAEKAGPSLRYPGFPVDIGGFDELHALSLTKAAHVDVGECRVAGNPGTLRS